MPEPVKSGYGKDELNPLARILILAGIFMITAGVLVNFGLGRLPGDIYIKRENISIYLPITSSIVISAIVTLILHILKK